MCGILGALYRSGEPDPAAFQDGLARLKKRGPDREGCAAFPGVLLGHRRLAIRDLSRNGDQPMAAGPGGDAVLVYNGELYNAGELKQSLDPRLAWRGTSDTEVLLNAFLRWGPGVCPRLDGMFAFAVFEPRRRRLTLARDGFGKKPLYYYHDARHFLFASELKGLLPLLRAAGVPCTLDPAVMPRYLVHGYVPGENALLARVRRLPSATVLVFEDASWRIVRQDCFWTPQDVPLDPRITAAEAVERTEALLDAATRRRLVSDVPVCVFLSGGVDSSLVAAHAARHSSGLQAHAIVYPESPEADEQRFAQKTAAALGLRLHAHPFCDRDVRETFASLLDDLDEPVADGALIPLHYLALQAVAQAPVALSGDGGDELFGGYPKYRAQLLAERTPALLRRAAAAAGRFLPEGPLARLLSVLPFPFYARQFLWGSGSPLPRALRAWMPDADWSPAALFTEAAQQDALWRQADTLNRSLFLDWRILLPDGYLVKSDRATMAASLEQRAPLLDRALAEFALSLPGALKLRGGLKSLLKQAAVRHVPRECIYRPKHGFGVPLDRWLRGELRPLVEPLLFETGAAYVDRRTLAGAWKEHLRGVADHRFMLLRVALLHALHARLAL